MNTSPFVILNLFQDLKRRSVVLIIVTDAETSSAWLVGRERMVVVDYKSVCEYFSFCHPEFISGSEKGEGGSNRNNMKTYYVYMMSNYTNGVLYIGVTNDLVRRVAEHKVHVNDGFTARYNCKKLVYFDDFENVDDAISREKQLKRWHRAWKNNLVAEMNPQWNDLSEEIGVTDEILESVAEYYKELKEL